MLTDQLPTADHDDSLGIGANGGHLTHIPALDAVAVALEGHQTRRGDAAGFLSEAVERHRHCAQVDPLLVPHLNYLVILLFRVVPFPGQLQATRRQMLIEFSKAREPELGREQPLAHVPDLVLNLALLPARGTPPKNSNALPRASSTISWLSRGYATRKNARL